MYTMSNGKTWLSNKKYTSIIHDWSLIFDIDAIVEEVSEDRFMPGVNAGYTFTMIDRILAVQNYSTVDVIGILVG